MSHERLAGANVELPSSSLLCNANKMIISREHIDSLRAKFESLPNKTPDNQEILLELEDNQQQPKEPSSTNGGAGGELVVEVAQLVIKSGAKNALSGRMMSQLTERLDQLESWAMANNSSNTGEGRRLARCLLIRGHGGTFCSGSDLITARHTTTNQLAGWELAQLMQYNLRRLAQLPLISVAFIEGYALGGGAELALAADMRLMSGEARLGFVHAKNGICCGWSGGFRLVQLAGRARALELMSSARLIGHQEAQQFGLCEQRADSLDEALKFVRGHAIESERTSAAVKLLVEETSSGSSSAELALQLECKLFAATWGKEAHLRALDRNSKHYSSSSSK